MKPFIQSLKSLTLALILVGGVSAVSAANTWTAPTVGAPNGNVDAPINVSPVTQFKKGGIVIEGLNASNEILAFPFSVLNGNVGIGTATPKGKLSVMGTALANDFCIHDVEGVSTGKCLSGSTGESTGTSNSQVSAILGPLPYTGTNTDYQKNSTFNLPVASEVMIISYANTCTLSGSSVRLAVDGVDRDYQYYSMNDCDTNTLSTKLSLSAGNHTVKVYSTDNSTIFTSSAQYTANPRPVSTYVYVLGAGVGASAGISSGGGVSKIVAGSGVNISPTDGTGEVTVSSTGGIAAVPTGWRPTLSCGPVLTNPVGLPGAQANASAVSFKYAYTNGGNTYVYVSEPLMALQRVSTSQSVPFTMILWQTYNSSGAPISLHQTGYNSMQYTYVGTSIPCTTSAKI